MILWKIYFWFLLILFFSEFLVRSFNLIRAGALLKYLKELFGHLLLVPLVISNFLWAYNKLWLSSLCWKVYFLFVLGLVFYRVYFSKPTSVKRELKYDLMENPVGFYTAVATFAPAFVALFLHAFFR